jgi:hypothetical protein
MKPVNYKYVLLLIAQTPGVNVIKTFLFVIYELLYQARVFVLTKLEKLATE